MRYTIEHPRVGNTITEISDISRAVPDPCLFQVPEGYEIREPPPPTPTVPTVLDQILRDTKPVIPPPPFR